MDSDSKREQRGSDKMEIDSSSNLSSAEESKKASQDKVRALLMEHIDRYMNGCGNPQCANTNCASHVPPPPPLSKADVVRKALSFVQTRAPLCPRVTASPAPSPVPSPSLPNPLGSPLSPPLKPVVSSPTSTPSKAPETERKLSTRSDDSPRPCTQPAHPLDLNEVSALFEEAKTSGDYKKVIRRVGHVFSEMNELNYAFVRKVEVQSPAMCELASAEEKNPGICFPDLDRAYALLMAEEKVASVLTNSLARLIKYPEFFKIPSPSIKAEELRKYLIILECPWFQDADSYDTLSRLLKHISSLPKQLLQILRGWFSRLSASRLRKLVIALNTFLVVRYYQFGKINDDVFAICRVLTLLNDASQKPAYAAPQPIQMSPFGAPSKAPVDPHGFALPTSHSSLNISSTEEKKIDSGAHRHIGVSAMEVDAEEPTRVVSSAYVSKYFSLPTLEPKTIDEGDTKRMSKDVHTILPFDVFYNDAVNDIDDEAIFLQHREWMLKRPSICDFPFILNPAFKTHVLQLDARYQMRDQMHEAIERSFMGMAVPYLVLHVRRDNLIGDTLTNMHEQRVGDFKKPLKVKFVGEEGIDEGGVRKEFFQLIIKELFESGYDMFTYDAETGNYWFNKDTTTTNIEFELIGTMMGLAIYNSVILDIHFPSVIYKKLVDQPPTFADFKESFPTLARSFEKLLSFDGDVESTFCQTFSIEWEVFGETKVFELKEGGSKIPLSNENRTEYVDLYIDYVIDKSISKQFKSFYHGFHKVVGGDALRLFRPEEVELLVCGSSDLDFEALEASTEYDSGYNKNSAVIRNFWKVVHDLTLEEKKQLLCFCTGTDRVPIKGLASLGLTISRQGPDSDRLPTAHTCFNHLLLPDYSSLQKLERNLKLAIQNSKGFGLL